MEILRQGRRFCFTWNNPDGEPNPKAWPNCRYCIYQKEEGEKKHTPHYQGYVEFTSPIKPRALSALLPKASFRNSNGTREQNITYCSKEEGRIEEPVIYDPTGTQGGQGARNDVWALKRLVDEGCTDLEIWDECPKEYLRFYRGIERIKRLKTPPRDWKTEVHLYIGPPGTGKSRKAMQENPGAYWKSRDLWWDDYAGHEVVIIDDFYGWLPFDFLLRLLDRYPLPIQNKGGFVQFTAKKIIITSNTDPFEWYGKDGNFKGDMQALYRRFDKIFQWPAQTAIENFPGFTEFKYEEVNGLQRTAYDMYRSKVVATYKLN